MKRRLGILLLLAAALLLGAQAASAKAQRPGRQHVVYFADTPDELNVYRVFGETNGKTLMIIGGIQGDEPGGFLTADLYTDVNLAKGNLIVVPRANFYSIILRHRGPDGDMNRQFGDPVTAKRHEKIIAVLKALMAESDLLLNLHEGSGFYRHRWEGPMANPKRFGQSLIADTDKFTTKRGEVIDLEAMAERILRLVNPHIPDCRYHLLFNNHRTSASDSAHKEQRRSATYFALTQCNIPAFGVETSKSLPSVSMKMQHHKLVINAFMADLDIVPTNPGLCLEQPELKYLVLSVNGQLPVVLDNKATLRVAPGDRLNIMHIEANFDRGLSCDILGQGSVNDLRHDYQVDKPTRIVVRKDYQEIGHINVAVAAEAGGRTPALRARRLYFLVEAQGERRMVAAGETMRLVKGDRLQIVDLISNLDDQRDIEVNFKGFVPRNGKNSGEDRGHVVDTAADLLPRFSSCASGATAKVECYRVVAARHGKTVGEITVEVAPAALDYVVVSQGAGPKLVYYNGETIRSKRGQRLEILDLKTNVEPRGNLSLALDNGGGRVALDGLALDPEAAPVRRMMGEGGGKLRLLVLRQEQAIGEIGLDLGGE